MENFEIERKWLMSDFPDHPIAERRLVEQCYLLVRDNLEIRVTRSIVTMRDYLPLDNPDVTAKVTIKKGNGLIRVEHEYEIDPEDDFPELLCAADHGCITKVYHIYDIAGVEVEVSHVDNSWYYAEVEFENPDDAARFTFPFPNLGEVTGDPYWAMKNYWRGEYFGVQG